MRSSSLIWTTLVFQLFMPILPSICLQYQDNTTVMFTLKSLFKIAVEDSTLIATSLSLLSMFGSSDFCNRMKRIRNELQQTHKHTHTHTLTHTHNTTHTHTHTHTLSLTHTTHTLSHTYTHTHTNTHAHTQTHMHTHTHTTHTHMHTHTHVY